MTGLTLSGTGCLAYSCTNVATVGVSGLIKVFWWKGWLLCWRVELDDDDMALMAEASGGEEMKSKTESVKKESKKDEEPLPDYDAVVAADVEGL